MLFHCPNTLTVSQSLSVLTDDSVVNIFAVNTLFSSRFSYLSVSLHAPLWRVLWREVEPQAGEHLGRVPVLPDELHLRHRDEVRVRPDLDEEELAQAEDARPLLVVGVADGLVEGVAGVVAARGPHELKGIEKKCYTGTSGIDTSFRNG